MRFHQRFLTPWSLLLLTLLLLSGRGSVAVAQQREESRKAFESLFGDRLKAVRATPDREDDFDLARNILENAGVTEDAPGLVLMMCNAAYDLTATSPGGFALAAKAMRLLIEKAPQEAIDAPDRLVDVLRRQHARSQPQERAAAAEELINALALSAGLRMKGGDDAEAAKLMRQAVLIAESIKSDRLPVVKHQLDVAQSRAQAQIQARRITGKLKENPQDTGLHSELARLYLIELGSATKALPHAAKSNDASLEKIARMASGSLERLSAEQCLQLADWYHDASAGASTLGKLVAMGIARDAYARYLLITKETGLSPARAKLAVSELEKSMAAMKPAGKAGGDEAGKTSTAQTAAGKTKVMEKLSSIRPEDGWVDVMKMIDPARAHRGTWMMEKGALHRQHTGAIVGGAWLDLPFDARGISYEIEIVFEPVADGSGSWLSVHFLAGQSGGLLEIGRGSKTDHSGIGEIDRKSYLDNEAHTRGISFPAGKQHTLHLAIKAQGPNVQLQSTANGKAFVQWKGVDSSLTLARYPKLGLCGQGTMIFHRIRLRAIEGEIAPAGAR